MQIEPFTIAISDEKLEKLKSLLSSYELPRVTYESSQYSPPNFGVKHAWMEKSIESWKSFDWRAKEAELNELDHFIATVPIVRDSKTSNFKLHFIHQKSVVGNAQIIPLLLLHGWPGSFLEFIELSRELKGSRFDLIIPSLPGFGFSNEIPVEYDVGLEFSAEILHNLMVKLGYGSGYAIQGGDIGSFLARVMAAKNPNSVKAVHLNFIPSSPPITIFHSLFPHLLRNSTTLSKAATLFTSLFEHFLPSPVLIKTTGAEREGIAAAKKFNISGRGYSLEHATRPATAGFVMMSHPVALLAWIGEKFEDWSDHDSTPSEEEILTSLSLYWLTESFATSIHSYRELFGFTAGVNYSAPKWNINQPVGFSSFPAEITPAPLVHAQQRANIRWFRIHPEGGHFAALEKPIVLARDLIDCFDTIWPVKPSKL